MAGAKTGTHVFKLKLPEVPESLQQGLRCYKFDNVDLSSVGTFVTLRVDPKGYVLIWRSEITQQADSLELTNVGHTQVGRFAKLPPDFDKTKDTLAALTGGRSAVEECVMTVVCVNNSLISPSFITFVLPSPSIAQLWADQILSYCTNLLVLNGSVMDYLYRNYAKLRYCQQTDGTIMPEGIIQCFTANKDDRKKVETALSTSGLVANKHDRIQADKFTEDKFFLIYRYVTQRQELMRIFNDLQNPGNTKPPRQRNQQMFISLLTFKDFLNNEQRDPRLNEVLYPYYDERSARRLIEAYEPTPDMARKGLLSFDGFLRFLLSKDNAVVSEEHFDLRVEDMDQPMSHYFVASSHNTYLIGRQMGGKASVEMYRQVLLTGCRCIELDCWNGSGPNDDPVITHGFAMVNELPFKDVCEAIAECAFKISEYPLILSLENHCNPRQQAKMAQTMKQVFGDMLLVDPISSHPLEAGTLLPSPNQLKRKIILKNKKKFSEIDSRQNSVKAHLRRNVAPAKSQSFVSDQSDTLQDIADAEGAVDNELSKVEGQPSSRPASPDLRSLPPSHISEDGNSEASGVVDPTPLLVASPQTEPDDSESEVEEAMQELNIKVAKSQREEVEAGAELSALINYMQAVRYRGVRIFEEAEKRNLSCEVVSFGETKAIEYLKQYPEEFVNYNRRQISRIYPKGGRLDSSNFVPQTYWNAGCQMVALNYQVLDPGMQLNLGVFEMNGRSGYLLKPKCLRCSSSKDQKLHFDPFEDSAVENVVANQLSIKIISGQLLSDKKVTTHVLVELYGLAIDTVRGIHKTAKVENNGLNPVYESKEFKFPKIIMPDMASLRIAVIDESNNNKVLGQRILPITGLRPGYRHISLRNVLNQPLGLATLLVHILVKDYVPDAHVDLVAALVDPITYYSQINNFAEALVNPIAFQSKLEKNEQMLKNLVDQDECNGTKSSSMLPNKFTMSQSSVTSVPKSPSKLLMLPPQKIPLPTTQFSLPEGQTFGAPPKTSGRKDDLIRHQAGSILRPGKIAGVNASMLETYDLRIPTMESLTQDKKVFALMKKHQRDIELLKKKHEKERSALHARHEKRLDDAKHQRTPSRLNRFASTRLLATRRPVLNGKHSSCADTNDMLADLVVQQRGEETETCTRQLREELDLIKMHKNMLKAHYEAIIDEKQRSVNRTLDTLYNREKQNVIKQNELKRMEEIQRLKATYTDPDELSRQKQTVISRNIQLARTERQKLDGAKEQRQLDLEAKFDDLRKNLTNTHQKMTLCDREADGTKEQRQLDLEAKFDDLRKNLINTHQQEVEELEVSYERNISLGVFPKGGEVTPL